MSRPRDRASSQGLLPCMEARPWKDGKTYTYRILARGKWVSLGTDKAEALRKGTKKVDRIQISPALLELRGRLLVHQGSPLGAVFPNRKGDPYTGQGFACLWGRLMREAVALGLVKRRFTFHDLRAHYATEHKRQTGALQEALDRIMRIAEDPRL